MPEGEVAKLNIGVEAKLDKYGKNLKKAEKMAATSAKKIESHTSRVNFGGRLVESALRATTAMGTLEIAVKGVDAVGEALAGNFDKSAELIKQMPAGIGPLATAMESVLGKITGISAETEKILKATERIKANQSKRIKEFQQATSIRDEALKSASDLSFQAGLMGMSDHDKDKAIATREYTARMDKLRSSMGKAGGLAGTAGKEAVAAIQSQMAAEPKLYNMRNAQRGKEAAGGSDAGGAASAMGSLGSGSAFSGAMGAFRQISTRFTAMSSIRPLAQGINRTNQILQSQLQIMQKGTTAVAG